MSPEKSAKRNRAAHDQERARVIKDFHLDEDQVARLSIMDADDPVSAYRGFPRIQAEMMVDEMMAEAIAAETSSQPLSGGSQAESPAAPQSTQEMVPPPNATPGSQQ